MLSQLGRWRIRNVACFSCCVSYGLPVEEFYDFVGGNRGVIWTHAYESGKWPIRPWISASSKIAAGA